MMRDALALGLALLTGGAGAQTFTSGGAPIAIERFEATGGGAGRPAVLLLHGADGLTFGSRYRTGAQLIAAAGYEVFLVHYLDRTGDRWAAYGEIGQKFAPWTDTVRDAVTWVSGQPGIDPERVGVVGISLGGALALAAAAGDRRIKAVVDYFGFVPATLNGRVRLPPTLILHGAEDRIVPVSNAHRLDALLKAAGVPHETVIYPDQGHVFTGEALADSGRRVVGFLGRHLRAGARRRQAGG